MSKNKNDIICVCLLIFNVTIYYCYPVHIKLHNSDEHEVSQNSIDHESI